MGIETIAILGLTALQAMGSMSQAEDEAEATVEQANIQAEDKAKETRILAARQQASFLNSGLTLEGTPMAAIQNTFQVGLEDINQITSNANKQSKNIISAARNEAISSFASAGMGASFGGGSMFGSATKSTAMSFLPENTLVGMNGTSNVNNAYSALEIKDSRGFF